MCSEKVKKTKHIFDVSKCNKLFNDPSWDSDDDLTDEKIKKGQKIMKLYLFIYIAISNIWSFRSTGSKKFVVIASKSKSVIKTNEDLIREMTSSPNAQPKTHATMVTIVNESIYFFFQFR